MSRLNILEYEGFKEGGARLQSKKALSEDQRREREVRAYLNRLDKRTGDQATKNLMERARFLLSS